MVACSSTKIYSSHPSIVALFSSSLCGSEGDCKSYLWTSFGSDPKYVSPPIHKPKPWAVIQRSPTKKLEVHSSSTSSLMQPHCGDLHFTSWIPVSTSFLFSPNQLETFSSLVVLMSQILEALFKEKPNKLINLEHADVFDESSPLVPSSSSFLWEVEHIGSYVDAFLLFK